jgi:hypothetical protein
LAVAVLALPAAEVALFPAAVALFPAAVSLPAALVSDSLVLSAKFFAELRYPSAASFALVDSLFTFSAREIKLPLTSSPYTASRKLLVSLLMSAIFLTFFARLFLTFFARLFPLYPIFIQRLEQSNKLPPMHFHFG